MKLKNEGSVMALKAPLPLIVARERRRNKGRHLVEDVRNPKSCYFI